MYLTPKERIRLSNEKVNQSYLLKIESKQNRNILRQSIKLDPTNDIAHKELALYYLESNNLLEWDKYISKAVELNATHWQLTRGYYSLYYLQDFESALVDFYSVEQLDVEAYLPYNTHVAIMKGLCYLGLNNVEKAKAYFKSYLEKEYLDNSQNALVCYYLALCHQENDPLTCINVCNQGLSYEPIPDLYFLLSKVYKKNKKSLLGTKALKKAKELICMREVEFTLLHQKYLRVSEYLVFNE